MEAKQNDFPRVDVLNWNVLLWLMQEQGKSKGAKASKAFSRCQEYGHAQELLTAWEKSLRYDYELVYSVFLIYKRK